MLSGDNKGGIASMHTKSAPARDLYIGGMVKRRGGMLVMFGTRLDEGNVGS